MTEEVKKKVDESWKEQAVKEKTEDQKKNEGEIKKQFQQASFPTFISSLAMQSLMFLGHMPNPMTNKTEVDISQAKYLIDILNILQEKTKGNLSKEEEQMFTQILYDLRVKFVETSNKAE